MPTSLLPRRALPVAAALLALLPASAAASSSVVVRGTGTAQFAASGAAVQFSQFIMPSATAPLTFVLLPVGVRPACSDGPLRRCARRVRREGQVVRWRLIAPASFFVPDTRLDARVRIIAASSFDLSVTGCGALYLKGAGTYAINGRAEVQYDGVVRRRVACRTSGAGAP